MALTWASPEDEGRTEGQSRVTFEIEPLGEVARLIVTHDRLEEGSDMQKRVADGWPRVLSSLKTYLETGRGLPEPILSLAATPMRSATPVDRGTAQTFERRDTAGRSVRRTGADRSAPSSSDRDPKILQPPHHELDAGADGKLGRIDGEVIEVRLVRVHA